MAYGTLYTYPDNFRADKILIAAQFSSRQIDVVSSHPNFVFGETNKKKDFLKKFPLGKVPAFESDNGLYIFESNAIAHYVGNEQLRGKTAVDQAHIIQWISFADNEIFPSACALAFPAMSIVQPQKTVTKAHQEVILQVLSVLDKHLLFRTYLVGEQITLADIAVMSNLRLLFEHVLELELRQQYGNVIRWFTTMVNQPQVKSVIGEFKFCEKQPQFDQEKFLVIMKLSGIDAAALEETKKGKKKPAPEEVDDDEMDEILAAEPKPTDPFECFPKGTFGMDDFKRVYSNEDEKVSVPYFWEKFDKDNYSIWYCEYKYPEELTQVFMSCNLISGMFQRLDKLRKNAFGSMVLFGADNASTIAGIWIWRGHQLVFALSPDWMTDFESYTWKKLDPDVDDTKKMVNEYLSWSGDFGGKRFNQAKIFK